MLARPRLSDALARGAGARLVLLRAPAGFGKTTFMVEHCASLRSNGHATAWLTLDEADNDVSRFLAHMLAAFQAIDPTLALISTDLAHPDPPPAAERDLSGAAIDLIHHVSMQHNPFAIFLDNLEVIQAPAVIGLVRRLVDALPVGGQLIAGTREAPELGLGRLRAHGHLLEVNTDVLRFSLAESAALLRGECALALTDEQIESLHQRTQGWAAALWLAALALRDHPDPAGFVHSFSGSHAAVTDYLLEDVLARQPIHTREFLMSASVPDELAPDFCNRLTGRDDSRAMLSSLERAGLFVIPQGTNGDRYRFHPLFRDFLYSQFQRVDPTGLVRVHRAASDWYLDEGQSVAAIDHLIRAGDADHAAQLLRTHAQSLLWRGRVRLLARLHDRMPASISAHADPASKLTYGWALTLTQRYPEAIAQLDQIEAREQPDPVIAAPVAAQRAFVFAMTDQIGLALDAWEACKGTIPADTQPFVHSIQQNSHAFCLIAANRFNDARAAIERGRPSHRHIGSSFNLAVASCLEATIDLAQGRVRLAVERCRDALASATTHPGLHVSGSTIAAAFLAEANYAAGLLPEAQKLLEAYLPLIEEVAAPDQLISSYITLARIAHHGGDATGASRWIASLERRGIRLGLPRLSGAAHLERSRIALIGGDLQSARTGLARACDACDWDPGGELSPHAGDIESPVLGRLRLLVHGASALAAIEPLHQAIERAQAQRRERRAHHLRVLLALALEAGGKRGEALRTMTDVAQFARGEGLARSIADEGPKALSLLAQVPTTAARPGASTIEPLTGRERRILGLLAEGHPNRTIAQRMFISESTVKTHLRSINAKLGADNRTHAVALSRRLGLLPDA